jgi:hypothetical protein
MTIDPAQLAAIEAEIKSGIDIAAGVASTVAPQYAPFIVLGQAVAAAFPPLINDVIALIEQTEPDAAANAALALKIASLANPAAL